MIRTARPAITKLSSFLLLGFAVLLSFASVRAQNPITINQVGTASPYPSVINVSGQTGVVTKVTVTLTGFSHTFPDDVDILLVAPNGTSAIIMSDVGNGFPTQAVNITLDDAAAANLPDEAQITSGTYKPTNIEAGDQFVAPAPNSSANTALSTFNNLDPHGAWSLYVIDDSEGDSGSITNFSLTIQTGPLTAAGGSLTGRVVTARGVLEIFGFDLDRDFPETRVAVVGSCVERFGAVDIGSG